MSSLDVDKLYAVWANESPTDHQDIEAVVAEVGRQLAEKIETERGYAEDGYRCANTDRSGDNETVAFWEGLERGIDDIRSYVLEWTGADDD